VRLLALLASFSPVKRGHDRSVIPKIRRQRDVRLSESPFRDEPWDDQVLEQSLDLVDAVQVRLKPDTTGLG
jgi:hypothetical protein